jgi:hypothetical protein
VDFLEKHDLGGFAQVFALYVLPGTAMRDTAAEDGLVFEAVPPYRIIRTATMDEQAIHDTLRAAEVRLGRRLDEQPRPHLVAETPGTLDVFRLELDHSGGPERDAAARPGAQHCALWFEGEDLFARRAELLRAIEARQTVDPYATLDVVLAPKQPFPLDLISLVQGRLDAARPSYATRSLKHRGETHSQRLSVVLRGELPLDWVEAVREHVQVFREQSLQQAAADATRLGDDLPAARVVGAADEGAHFNTLEDQADPECVVFADRGLEARWQRRVLGYGDAGQ